MHVQCVNEQALEWKWALFQAHTLYYLDSTHRMSIKKLLPTSIPAQIPDRRDWSCQAAAIKPRGVPVWNNYTMTADINTVWLLSPTQIPDGIPKYLTRYTNIWRYTQIPDDIPKYLSIYPNTWRYTQTSDKIPKHLTIYPNTWQYTQTPDKIPKQLMSAWQQWKSPSLEVERSCPQKGQATNVAEEDEEEEEERLFLVL